MSPVISGLVTSVASMIFNAATAGAGKSQAARGNGEAAADPSSFVHLSPEAESLAGLAGKAVAVNRSSSPLLPTGMAGGAQGRSVSQEDFQALLERFGATQAQTKQLVAGFDTNKDGRIGHDEFLQGLSKTHGVQTGSDFSQTVLQLMDRAGDANGTVTRQEFTALSTAFASAQSAARQG